MSERRSKRQNWTFSGDGSAPAVSGERSTRGISADDIDVVFQPIVDVASGELFAAEMLVRCRWSEYKNPVKLFEVAARERSCGRLGRIIREVAFEQAPELPLFVNLHPQELSSRWLVRPDDPINFHSHSVYLEITESAAFDHFEVVMSTLKEVCSRSDAPLVVDDFGAGYSNLQRVVELEPAVVKLDRALIKGMHESPRQRTLVLHVVRLCNALGAKVVAEGIETLGELRAIRDAGVDYAQGYLLARPGNPMPKVHWPQPTVRRRVGRIQPAPKVVMKKPSRASRPPEKR